MNISNKNLSSIYDRDNISIFAVLKYTIKPDFCFIVANAHLLFNNNRGDIKLAQSYQILNSMKVLREFYKNSKIILRQFYSHYSLQIHKPSILLRFKLSTEFSCL
jgi:hypothetical protein